MGDNEPEEAGEGEAVAAAEEEEEVALSNALRRAGSRELMMHKPSIESKLSLRVHAILECSSSHPTRKKEKMQSAPKILRSVQDFHLWHKGSSSRGLHDVRNE